MKRLLALAALPALLLGACATTDKPGTAYQKDVMRLAKNHLDADKSVVIHEVYLDGEGGQIARVPVQDSAKLVAEYFRNPTGMISTGAFLVRRKGPDATRTVTGPGGRTDLPADYAFDYDSGQRWLCLQEWCVYISPEDGGVGYGVFYRGGSSGGDPLRWSNSAAFTGTRFQVPTRAGVRALPQLPEYTEKQVRRALKKKSPGGKALRTAGGILYSLIPGTPLLELATREADHGPGIGGRLIGDTYLGDFSADLTPEQIDAINEANTVGEEHRASLQF